MSDKTDKQENTELGFEIYSFNFEKGFTKLSTELPVESAHSYIDGLEYPKISRQYLRNLIDVEPTHRWCLTVKANLIAGLGLSFENKDKNHPNYSMFEKFILQPNDIFGQSLSKIIKQVVWNRLWCGYGDYQIIKLFDRVNFFANINVANTLVECKRRNGMKTIYVKNYHQLDSIRKTLVKFKPFVSEPKDGIRYIHRVDYDKYRSSYYSDPIYLPIEKAIVESAKINALNNAFFDNKAKPEFIIIVTGGQLSEPDKNNVVKKIAGGLEEHKGYENRGKTAVLSSRNKNTKIEIHDLTRTEDGQYTVRQEKLEYSISRAHGVPPRISSLSSKGSAQLSGGSAPISELFNFYQGTIRPEQFDHEEQLNMVLHALFGFNPKVKLNTLDLNSQKDMTTMIDILYNSQLIGKAEARENLKAHGIVEIDPKDMPTDLSETNGTSVNSDGDIRGNSNIYSDKRSPYNISTDRDE